MGEALRQGQRDKGASHHRAIERLNGRHARLQNRIDQIYLDKLDGEIEEAFYLRNVAQWRAEQAQTRARIERHQKAAQNYIEQGIRLVDFAGMPRSSTGARARPSGRPCCVSSCPARRYRVIG